MTKMDEIIKQINKEAGEDIMTYGLSSYDYERIPLSSPRMNYCLFGGLPVGKLIEFYGEEHGGKTTTTLDVVKNFQILEKEKGTNRKVLYVDCENTLDVEWAKKLGVDVDNLYIVQPEAQSAEKLFQLILDSICTGEIGLAVADSLGVMVSQSAMEKTVEEKTYAGISTALTAFTDKALGVCQKYKCTFIGINQLRDDLKNPFGGTKTPGGRAWKHGCSVRIEFTHGKFFDYDGKDLTRNAENPAGNYVMFSMTKNKTCPPTRRTGFYTLRYDTGIDYVGDLIEVAIKYGYVEKSGAWFSVVDKSTGEIIANKIQGQNTLKKKLVEEPELFDRLSELVNTEIFKIEY